MKCHHCDCDVIPKKTGEQTELRICAKCGETFCDKCTENMERCPACKQEPTYPIAYNGKCVLEEIVELIKGK